MGAPLPGLPRQGQGGGKRHAPPRRCHRCAFSARLRAAPRLAVQLAAITVGHATVERLPVAISELFPYPAAVDGLLGMDFLGQFIMTLDRAAQQMWLASRQPVKP